ncbi:MAG: ester cyclase [Cyanobacteria bacterium P01_D01_bin.50]
MDRIKTESMLREYYASWGTGNPENIVRYFKETSIFEDLAFQVKFEGIDGVRKFAKFTYNGVPDFKVEPTRIVVQGSSAAAAWLMSGTHSGDFPNLPATGNRFEVRASSIIRVEEEKILEMVDYWNPISFQKAVGLA